ncbi:FAD-binding oxidoreductase [Arthrobacter sp. NtRootA1]|uniref:FAD-binding oxidoreductase n=1 Tax=Micrococcaceae TaxID=1268 RepID=UPI001CC593C7|nr:FAD-binding oxidoreductase [Arthrobacter sp. NtRootA1]BCW05882.1 oxidoreductase [Arthrobacter sp. NtRootA1]
MSSVEDLVDFAVARGEDGYEEARRGIVWQENVPDRFPDVIVKVKNQIEVAQVVRWAAANNMKVSARSGGHAWAASSLRDGGVLIDLSALNSIEVDVESHLARVGPGTKGEQLNGALAPYDLFFPTGHCPSVGLGGFLLGGGYGVAGGKRESCMSVRAIDVVTPQGELIRADETQNVDYYWAARGSGAGFFGIVTSFHLEVYPRPSVGMNLSLTFPLSRWEEALRWSLTISDKLDNDVELYLLIGGYPDSEDPSVINLGVLVAATIFADSEEAARAALQPLKDCPVAEAAIGEAAPTSIEEIYALNDLIDPPGYRYAVDNMWTSAGIDDLIPQLAPIIDNLPSPRSYLLWWLWTADDEETAAVSSPGPSFYSAYAIYEDAADDERAIAWVTENMRALEPWSNGVQLNDENLGRRYFRPLSEPKLKKLKELRDKHDGSRRFFNFPGFE